MKLNHIKIKPTMVTLSELNNDFITNDELFAESMLSLQQIAKGIDVAPFWATKSEMIAAHREIIRNLLV